MTKKTFRVGALGTGTVFNLAHVPAYVGLDSVELGAIYDPDPAAAESTRERYLTQLEQAAPERGMDLDHGAVVICDSAEELLAQVDIIDICAPVRWHAPYAARALEQGVHVMTEKPMARTWWEAQRVETAARASMASFQLNDDNVFIPRYRTLRNIIESGMIGEVQTIWIARGSRSSARNPWFWDPMQSGGGCVMDYGSHAVTSTWFLIGYDKVPAQIRSISLRTREPTRLIAGRYQQIAIDDDALFKVCYVDPSNGDWVTVVSQVTWSWPELGPDGSDVRGYIEVQGSTGTVTSFVDEEGQDCLKVTNRSFGERLIPVRRVSSERESFQAEIKNFVKSIQAGVPSILNARVGVGVMAVLDGIKLSELRGRVSVTPEDVKAFSADVAGTAPDPWQGGDQVMTAFLPIFRQGTRREETGDASHLRAFD
jgi:predicted dehydrogenase